MTFDHRVLVCECGDLKRLHLNTKQNPSGPCSSCSCNAFKPEKQCRTPSCGHGKKAHRSGRCHECGCKNFDPIN